MYNYFKLFLTNKEIKLPILNMLSCNSDGLIKFSYGEHIITTTCKKMFKWKSETLTREDKAITKDIEHQILCYKRIIDKGAKRVWSKE